jgi:hypothetical protein
MPEKKLAPHLVKNSEGMKRCSVCGLVIESNFGHSIPKSFKMHVRKHHKPVQDVKRIAAA